MLLVLSGTQIIYAYQFLFLRTTHQADFDSCIHQSSCISYTGKLSGDEGFRAEDQRKDSLQSALYNGIELDLYNAKCNSMAS